MILMKTILTMIFRKKREARLLEIRILPFYFAENLSGAPDTFLDWQIQFQDYCLIGKMIISGFS